VAQPVRIFPASDKTFVLIGLSFLFGQTSKRRRRRRRKKQ